MSESTAVKSSRVRRIRHKGRGSQILIYLGKQFRFFINESDWKVLPMAAVIAALVGMVIRRRFFVNMEGSLIGAFALSCMAIWNGCFNSIQSVCRERAIIKREHRSGMHISSYVAAHMIYQLFLCTAQTGLTMYVLQLMQVPFPAEGFMTKWMIVDVSISMLLITYASDMMSLFISSLSRTTTGAMTIMPFVLIFQLVFSGGIIPLPAWSQKLSDYTISNYGVKVIAAQSGYNELPMVTAWNTLAGMRNSEIGGTVTLGQILDLLDSPAAEKHKDTVVMKSVTVGEAAEILNAADESLHLRETQITDSLTLGDVLDILQASELIEEVKDEKLNDPVTLGQITGVLKNNKALQARRDKTYTIHATVGDLFDAFGEENIKNMVQQKTAKAAYKSEYDRNIYNIFENWFMLCVFALGFALLSVIVLERIDKDKR